MSPKRGECGLEGLEECEQLADGFLDAPCNVEFEVGGYDVLQPLPLGEAEILLIEGELLPVLPDRIGGPATPPVGPPGHAGGRRRSTSGSPFLLCGAFREEAAAAPSRLRRLRGNRCAAARGAVPSRPRRA